jgi:twitching motility protein PilJ
MQRSDKKPESPMVNSTVMENPRRPIAMTPKPGSRPVAPPQTAAPAKPRRNPKSTGEHLIANLKSTGEIVVESFQTYKGREDLGSRRAFGFGQWLSGLKVAQKLGLIAAVFALPVAVLLYLLVSAQAQSIDFAAKEKVGVQYLRDVFAVYDHLGSHRLAANAALRDPSAQNKQKRSDEATKVDASLGALTKNVALSSEYGIANQLKLIDSEWQKLKVEGSTLNQSENLSRHSDIISGQLNPMIVTVANKSNLTLDPDLDTYYLQTVVANDLPNLSDLFARYSTRVFDLLSAKSFKAQDKYQLDTLITLLESNLAHAKRTIEYALEGNPALQGTVGEFNNQFFKLTTETINLSRQEVLNAAVPKYSPATWNTIQSKASNSQSALRDSTLEQLNQLLQNRIDRFQSSRLLSLALVGLALAFALGLLFWIAQLITRPLEALTTAAKRLADGDYSVDLPVTSNDEVGQLTQTINTTSKQLQENAENESRKLEAARSLQNNIGEFLGVAMDVSQGNLTRRGKISNDELGSVVDAFNLMTDEIGIILKDVSKVADQVNRRAQVMNVASSQIVQGAQSQANEANTARVQAEGVSESIRQMASGAVQNAQTAQQTLQASQAGQIAVQDTRNGLENIRTQMVDLAAGIQGLSVRSGEISDVVKTIGGIASQTNLLALGAALEAAGAGDAGLRFMAVADGVRKLAEDAASSAQRVAALIKSVQSEIQGLVNRAEGGAREVEAGYAVATKAGERLQEIATLAQQSARVAGSISNLAGQQVVGVEEVSQVVQRIASTAGQTESRSVQGQKAADELRALAEQLSTSLSRFQLPA